MGDWIWLILCHARDRVMRASVDTGLYAGPDPRQICYSGGPARGHFLIVWGTGITEGAGKLPQEYVISDRGIGI